MYLNKNIFLLLGLSLFFLTTSRAQIVNNYVEVAGAAELGMLSTGIAKSYLAKFYLKDNQQALYIEGGITGFEAEKKLLAKRTTFEPAKAHLEQLEDKWAMYKYLLEDDVDQEMAESVIDMSNRIVELSNKLYNAYMKQAFMHENSREDKALYELVSMSGRQATLAQSICINVFAIYGKLGMPEVNKKSWADARDLFSSSLRKLENSQYNTALITAKIERFFFLKN